MIWYKRFRSHPVLHACAARLLYGYIRLVAAIARCERVVHPQAAAYLAGTSNAIFCFWHGRMVMMPVFCPPARRMHVLISLHRDGKLIADIMRCFRFSIINGSTSRGGKEAVIDMLKQLKAGHNISITPDGPRGPAQVFTRGAVSLARLSGQPIIPVTFAADRVWRFRKSWDQFRLVLPFSRVVFMAGEPMMIPPEIDEAGEETWRERCETAMNQLVEHAEMRLYG